MPVVDIQRRLRPLGKIRMGDKGGRGQPQRLAKFRITSPSEGLVRSIAGLYGGEAKIWEGSPDGVQWEVYTETDQLPIAIPPMEEPFSQHYELWSGAGCQRRCDGRTATVAGENGMRERDCLCDADNRECKLTTRASVMLPEVPGIGVWTIESHGYNAAVEMTGALAFLGRQASQGVYLEAVLRLEQRSKRVPGQPVSRFVVPVIDTPTVSIGEIMLGGAAMPATTPQIAPVGRPAIPATTAPPSGDGAGFSDPESSDTPSSPSWGTSPPPPSGDAAKRSEVMDADDDGLISEPQRRRLFAIAKEAGVSTEFVKAVLVDLTGQDSTKKIPREKYEAICAAVEAGPAAEHVAAGGGALFPPERQEDVA